MIVGIVVVTSNRLIVSFDCVIESQNVHFF